MTRRLNIHTAWFRCVFEPGSPSKYCVWNLMVIEALDRNEVQKCRKKCGVRSARMKKILLF